jgi:nucleoid-associated protein YgaU
MKCVELILAATILAFPSLVVAQPAGPADHELEAVDPFKEDVTQVHFHQCYPETEARQLEALKLIKYWGYRHTEIAGCPPMEPLCLPGKWHRLRRTIRIDAPDGHYNTVLAKVLQHANGSCTSPRDFSNFWRTVENKVVRFGVHVEERRRACTFLGDVTLASGEADLNFGAVLKPDFSIDSYSYKSNESGKILGIGAGVLQGIIVVLTGGVFAAAIPIIAIEVLESDIVNRLNSLDFLGMGVNVVTSFDGTPIAKIGDAGYVKLKFDTQGPESGFRDAGGGALVVEVHQDAYVHDLDLEEVLRVRKLEIDFLNTLDETLPKLYVVQPRDTLWKVVGREYGDPRLFTLIAQRAGMRTPNRLNPGEQVELPRWWQICKELKPGERIVHKGDSLWKKAMAGHVPFDFKRVRHLSRNPNLIFPFEELTVLPEGKTGRLDASAR